MTLINRINDDKYRSSKNRSSKKIRHRNYSTITCLDYTELSKLSRSDNSSTTSFWLYRFVRAVAVVIGLLLLAALPLSATVLLLAALPLVLKAVDPDTAH
jgi:formate hydrogenlyase subunit 4